MRSKDPIAILGIPIDYVTEADVVERVTSWIKNSEKKARYIATVNLDFLTNALGKVDYPELLKGLREADLTTADGMPIVWISQWMGLPLEERITGSDLFFTLLKLAEKEGYRVFLFGGDHSILPTVHDKFPNLIVAGSAYPRIHTTGSALENVIETDRDLIEQINTSKADLLFLSLGNPKQEVWFQRIRHQIQVPVSVGIGGSFNFLSGHLERAPHWMQKWGLEWLFRLNQEPKRLWKRYFKNTLFFIKTMIPWALQYRRKRTPNIFRASDTLRLGNIEWIDAIEMAKLIRHPDTALVEVSNQLEKVFKWYRYCPKIFSSEKEAKKDCLSEPIITPYSILNQDRFAITLNWQGPLDASLELHTLYEKLRTQIGSTSCIIDLSSCSFLDSAGVGFLLKLKKWTEEKNRLLVILSPSTSVKQTLSVTKVDALFLNTENREEAENLTVNIKKSQL